MAVVGAGGVVIARWKKPKRFHKDYEKLTNELKDTTDQQLQDLCVAVRPPGLRFEKLEGHRDPDLYSIHVTGNYKVSFESTRSRQCERSAALCGKNTTQHTISARIAADAE